MHRLAEAFLKLGSHATLIQEEASFHPDCFYSEVNTIGEADWLRGSDLKPATDIVVLPETYNGEFLSYAPYLRLFLIKIVPTALVFLKVVRCIARVDYRIYTSTH